MKHTEETNVGVRPGHTPGPWQVIPRVTTPECCDFTVTVYDIHSLPADVFVGEADNEANARLIAAAPELLAAAKRAFLLFEGSFTPAMQETEEMLRVAIAKADGRA